MPNKTSLRRGKSTTSNSRTQTRAANTRRKTTATAPRSSRSAVGRQGRSVTFDSNHTIASGAQARRLNASALSNSQDAPINRENNDDEEDDDEGIQDDENNNDEDDEDDDDDEDDAEVQPSSVLVGYGQPIDSYGDRRYPTSDLLLDHSNTEPFGADHTLSPSFVGSATQTVMSFPAGHARGPGLPIWQGGNPPSSIRRRAVDNGELLPTSSPIVSSMERAAKRRRVDEEVVRENGGTDIDQGRDVMRGHRDATRRALPDVRALNEAARRMQTPVRPGAGSLAISRTPGPSGFNPVAAANNRRRRRGDEGHNVPPYQLGYYTPFSKSFLREGKAFFKNKVITENAFPSGDLRMDQGKSAWEHAIHAKPEAYANASLKTFTPHVLRLFGDTAWAFRGAVKTETKRIVLSEYALTPPNTLGASSAGPAGPLTFTQTRVKYLLDDNRFLYGLFHDRSDIPFTHIALCMVIERTVFVGLSPEMRNILNPMPASLVALAAAAIVNGLHEWSDGYHKKKAFKEETYGPIYRYFLKKLCELETDRPNRFKMLMASYFTFCTVSTQPEHNEHAEETDEDDWAICGSESEDDELIMAD